MSASILIASAQGSFPGVVERVVMSCDGAAQELWVRANGHTKRVPIEQVGVSGWACERTLAACDFEAAEEIAA